MRSQVAGILVRDVQDCDVLIEQILTAVFSRYIAASDVSNASDSVEVSYSSSRFVPK
jgi:hypothetical protein